MFNKVRGTVKFEILTYTPGRNERIAQESQKQDDWLFPNMVAIHLDCVSVYHPIRVEKIRCIISGHILYRNIIITI